MEILVVISRNDMGFGNFHHIRQLRGTFVLAKGAKREEEELNSVSFCF